MTLIILPLLLYRDGRQAPFDISLSPPANLKRIKYQAIAAPAEEACWAPASLFRALRVFPSGMEEGGYGELVPRYSVDLFIPLPEGHHAKLERLRVYAGSDELPALSLGRRVCEAVLSVPPSS